MLEKLVEMSNRYGSDPAYVLAGGGNTSFKDEKTLYIKGSGTSLATIRAEEFVAMDRARLDQMLLKDYPDEDAPREAAALEDLMDARLPGNENKRPSVETLLHNLFPYNYVLHVHPSLVNGLTCSVGGEREARRLFGDEFVWVPLTRPGFILSITCHDLLQAHKRRTGQSAQMLLLQNHGIFVAANTVEEIDATMNQVMSTLSAQLKRKPDRSPVDLDARRIAETEKLIESLYSQDVYIEFVTNRQLLDFVYSADNFTPLSSAFTPDHIVYCKAKFMYVERTDEMSQVFELFVRDNGYLPKVICIRNMGVFIVSTSKRELENAKVLFNDAVDVAVYSDSFGGYLHMTPELIHFILHWETEAYRQKVAAGE